MRTNRKAAIACACVAATSIAFAAPFEVKGITPGADVSTIDLKACRPIPNADSGIPGYRCDTTYGGAPAVMTLVGKEKIVAVKILVENQVMSPIRQALEEKWGSSSQPNRYIESYQWSSGDSFAEIKESRLSHGYQVFSVDMGLYRAIASEQKNKAKGDL